MATADIPDGLRQQAYAYYTAHKAITLNAIASLLGVDRQAFWRLRREWGWPPRDAALAASARGDGPGDDPARSLDPAGMRNGMREAASTLAHVTCARLNALVRGQSRGREIDHDRTARALAAYARTLTIAQSLLEQERTDRHEEDPAEPRSLHELRDELASHLERVVAEEATRGCDGLLV